MSDSVDATVDATSSRERIKRALSHGKKGRINKDLSNKIMLGVFRAAAYITTLVLVAIIAYVVINGLPHISLDFIFGWPQGVNAEGGIWPTIVSTVYVTALAMLICTPIAVLAAVANDGLTSGSLAALGLGENLGDGSGQRGLAVVDVTNGADVNMRLSALKLLFGHKALLLTGRPRTGLCLYTIVASQHTIEKPPCYLW